MKADLHPTYHEDTKVTCACGNVFHVGSIKPEMEVEICSSCHPFYTGKEKLVDTAGRIEKFKKRLEEKAAPKAKKERKKTPKVAEKIR